VQLHVPGIFFIAAAAVVVVVHFVSDGAPRRCCCSLTNSSSSSSSRCWTTNLQFRGAQRRSRKWSRKWSQWPPPFEAGLVRIAYEVAFTFGRPGHLWWSDWWIRCSG
jgi:hypothetical protein